MNYQKHYNKLTSRAPKLKFETKDWREQAPSWNNRDGLYREAHRIIPGCMEGKYTSENTAYLTAEEHYLAHQLLIKIYPDNGKLIYAARMMTVSAYGKVRNNKLYGWLRRKLREEQIKRLKGRRLSPKTEFKKGVRSNPEGEFQKGIVPWNIGKKDWLSEEQKELIRIANRKRKGIKKPPRTEEHSKNISVGRKGKGVGDKNGMASQENRNKVAASKIGKKFYHDPITMHQIFVLEGTQPSNYIHGRI